MIALIYCRVDLLHMLAAFLFFRLFDILKPWPARRLEKLPGGWGIMLDDVAAGVYALLVVQVLQGWIAAKALAIARPGSFRAAKHHTITRHTITL